MFFKKKYINKNNYYWQIEKDVLYYNRDREQPVARTLTGGENGTETEAF